MRDARRVFGRQPSAYVAGVGEMQEPRGDQGSEREHKPSQTGSSDPLGPRAPAKYPGLPTGTGLGKYRILERIRATHNAVVYKGRDNLLDRLVIIKQMLPPLMDNPVACGLFRREAQFLAAIPREARHIIGIHELIEDPQGLFIVEEYVHGRWLENLIAKRLGDPRFAGRLLKTAAQGLRTLHALNIVHRGLCPGDIIVGDRQTANIVGMATAAHEGDLSPPPIVYPKYAAPELLLGEEYDSRVDLYALGMCVYEYCVGRLALRAHFGKVLNEPAHAIDFWEQWHRDLRCELPDASRLNPQVPTALSLILRGMTAKPVDSRFATIEQVLDAVATQLERPERAATRLTHSREPRPALGGPSQSGRMMLPGPTMSSVPGLPLAPLSRPVFRTTTQSVRPAPSVFPEGEELRSGPVRPAARGTVDSRAIVPQRRLHARPRIHPLPRPIQGEAIPAPKQVEEVHKPRPRMLAWLTVTILFLASAGTGGYLLWYYQAGPGQAHPIERVVAQAVDAYDQGRYEEAEGLFREASQMAASGERFVRLRDKADRWLLMVEARKALAKDDFEGAQLRVREAQKLGAVPAKVAEIQEFIWLKKDARRLMDQGKEAIARGDYAEVELHLAEYAERATAAGLDPAELENRLRQSRQDAGYRAALDRAEQALANGDYDRAMQACAEAEKTMDTMELRTLARRAMDAKRRAELVADGDRAMFDRDYERAAACFEGASEIDVSVELEKKIRLAQAYLLLQAAEQAIERGDLLRAEQDLNSSLWKSPTDEAALRLERMKPAFEAARLGQRADRAVEEGRFEEAEQLYRAALPNLPTPADDRVRMKIERTRCQAAVQRGDQAASRGDWEDALRAYEQGKRCGHNPEVEKAIARMRQKLGAATLPSEPSRADSPSE